MEITDLPDLPLVSKNFASKPATHTNTSDINWFTAALKKPTPATAHTPLDNRIAQPLNQRSALLQDLSNTAARALQKVSRSTNPVDMLKSTRAMSAFHLETVLSAKMISKTSQAIEKLTSLS